MNTHSRQGFTLVELLIALGILVLGMTGIFAVYLSATQQHARAVDNTNVAVAATGMLETARKAVAQDPTFDITKPKTGSVPGMRSYSYTMSFKKLDADGLRVLIELELTWKRRGEPQVHVFRTVALREQLGR